jgi:hypothetical protein
MYLASRDMGEPSVCCLVDARMGWVQFALLRELTNAGIHKAAVSSAQHSMRLREARCASGDIRECIVKSQAIPAKVSQRGGQIDRRRVLREFFARLQQSQPVL